MYFFRVEKLSVRTIDVCLEIIYVKKKGYFLHQFFEHQKFFLFCTKIFDFLHQNFCFFYTKNFDFFTPIFYTKFLIVENSFLKKLVQKR